MKNNVSIKILGEDMKRILHAVEAWMDDFKIKNKFYILYILCVLENTAQQIITNCLL